jgi:5-methylthioribose kinase
MRAELPAQFANDEMRRLHGEHIFVLPLHPNDFPLAPPIRARAERLWKDRALVAAGDAAWARYLEPRGSLLHGDVQGGNVLVTTDGPRVLDAEIAHVGAPAFDLGILIAHLCADRLAPEETDLGAAPRETWKAYTLAWSQRSTAEPPAGADVAQQAGFELLRRTLGAARIGAAASVEGAERLIDASVRWILDPAAAFANHFA